jgi:3-oxoacyl-[acyl-carrier protein] reductase
VNGGPVVLVTGAGRGIGRAAALRLAGDGFRLGLLARTEGDLRRVAGEAAARGGEAICLPGSVTDEATLGSGVRELEAKWGGVDALVNCAGAGSFAPVEATSPEEWRRILEVNLTGTYLACRAVLPGMLARERGQIVNLVSVAGKTAFANGSAYCASKWGVLGFTRALAAEVRRRGIRVTALCPGAVDTPFWTGIDHGLDVSLMLRPEHVADAIAFVLAQPATVCTDEMDIMPPVGVL